MNPRKFITKKGTIILSGRNSKNNEELVSQVEKDEFVFHTESRGSPFVNVKGKPKRGDLKIASIICARYSKEWKNKKNDIIVHKFKGKDMYKEKRMPEGTFGVKKMKKIKVKKSDIKNFEFSTK